MQHRNTHTHTHTHTHTTTQEAVRKLELPPIAELKVSEIITFDTAGERGGLAAIALENMLDLPVSNLCGGLIEWINSGGKLVDLNTCPVRKLHPFSRDLEKLISVENDFYLE